MEALSQFVGRSSSIVDLKVRIRELEDERGKLIEEIAALKAALDAASKTVQKVEIEAPKKLGTIPRRRLPSVAEIIAAVAEEWCIHSAGITGARRGLVLVEPRQVAMHLCCRIRADLSLPQIGALFRRDHSTIIHGDEKIIRRRQADPEFDARLTEIESRVCAPFEAAA